MNVIDTLKRLCNWKGQVIFTPDRKPLGKSRLVLEEAYFMKIKQLALLFPVILLAGCVTSGYEGQLGSVQSGDQLLAQREANRNIEVFSDSPRGYTSLGEVSVRRCHRSFVEAAPSIEAITGDLKIAAFAEGGDAISNVRTSQVNGLLANCWYVLEGTATVWRK